MVSIPLNEYSELLATKEAYEILLNVIAAKCLIPEFQEKLNEMKIDIKLKEEK